LGPPDYSPRDLVKKHCTDVYCVVSIQDQKSCFDEVEKEVAHGDWREFMRKIGTRANYLDEMYEKSFSKYNMLVTWSQKAGLYILNKILSVASAVSGIILKLLLKCFLNLVSRCIL